jgi:hypothetical protein
MSEIVIKSSDVVYFISISVFVHEIFPDGTNYAPHSSVQNCLPTHNNQINKLNYEKKALP